jgi:hypothetical protein
MYPAFNPTKLHFFCIGLRNIENTGDHEPTKCSISFDISGDDHDPLFTDAVKIIN